MHRLACALAHADQQFYCLVGIQGALAKHVIINKTI